jgi:hypothetical protein
MEQNRRLCLSAANNARRIRRTGIVGTVEPECGRRRTHPPKLARKGGRRSNETIIHPRRNASGLCPRRKVNATSYSNQRCGRAESLSERVLAWVCRARREYPNEPPQRQIQNTSQRSPCRSASRWAITFSPTSYQQSATLSVPAWAISYSVGVCGRPSFAVLLRAGHQWLTIALL